LKIIPFINYTLKWHPNIEKIRRILSINNFSAEEYSTFGTVRACATAFSLECSCSSSDISMSISASASILPIASADLSKSSNTNMGDSYDPDSRYKFALKERF
jgi:hypothetical protein